MRLTHDHYSHDNEKWNVDSVPVQTFLPRRLVTIPRVFAEEAYKEYSKQFGTSQSFERLHERGGFGLMEMIMFLFQRCKRLEKELKDAQATTGRTSQTKSTS